MSLDYITLINSVLFMTISILIVLGLESFKKPRLRFEIGTPGEIKENDLAKRTPAKFTHVFVYNEPMPKPLSFIWNRESAMSSRGWITFHDLDGQDIFGRKMDIRWANNPEPLSIDPQTGAVKGIDWDKMRVGNIWNIPPGQVADEVYGNLDIVMRTKDDPCCYGWNNNSYLHNWKNPEWKLGTGRYLVKIVIMTGGQTFMETIQIMNTERFEDFRLEHSIRKL